MMDFHRFQNPKAKKVSLLHATNQGNRKIIKFKSNKSIWVLVLSALIPIPFAKWKYEYFDLKPLNQWAILFSFFFFLHSFNIFCLIFYFHEWGFHCCPYHQWSHSIFSFFFLLLLRFSIYCFDIDSYDFHWKSTYEKLMNNSFDQIVFFFSHLELTVRCQPPRNKCEYAPLKIDNRNVEFIHKIYFLQPHLSHTLKYWSSTSRERENKWKNFGWDIVEWATIL